MSVMGSKPIDEEAESAPMSGRLFFLDLGAVHILSANSDGSDLKAIISEDRKLSVEGRATDRLFEIEFLDPGVQAFRSRLAEAAGKEY